MTTDLISAPPRNEVPPLVGFNPHWRIPMTLGLALCGKDFILAAADKQETVESKTVGRYTQLVDKIEKIDETCFYILAGPSWADLMFQAVAAKVGLCSPLSPEFIWYELAPKVQEEYEKKKSKEEIQILLLGFHADSTPVIYVLSTPMFSAFNRFTFWGVGSASQSQYFLNTIYKKQASSDELALIAYFCIRETHKQDPWVGQEMDIAVIRPDGIKLLDKKKLHQLSTRAEELSSLIKREFHL